MVKLATISARPAPRAALNAETEPPPGTGVPEAVFSKKSVIF
jgi:hypothetical protein